jgi:hypothetical protein
MMRGRLINILLLCIVVSCGEMSSDGESVGLAGSMARFAISGNHLYVVTSSSLSVYGIAAGTFSHVRDISIESGLETITTRSNYIYLGSRSAMYIYSIADPEFPEFLFRYTHIRSCDPVVVQGNRAYVTLRAGSNCGGGNNVLEIIDITNPKNPILLKAFGMTSPGGLGISGNCLFVCEGASGVKMINVANDEINVIKSLTDIHAYDVIVQPGTLTLTGEDGVFQYAYDCENATVNLKSKIPVVRAEQ